jgi:hypothetical protein
MSQNTGNTQAFIEAQQYSQFILQNLHDGLLPDQFTRDVSDFGTGTTLNIKTVGTATLQEVFEEQPLDYMAIDTGTVQLTITDYVGDAWSISDVLRQDGSQIDTLHAMRGVESTRALQEYFETRYLAVANSAHTAATLNLVNGVPHRWVADQDTTAGKMGIDDFRWMKFAFDKANAPQAGRIAIVDSAVEATINGLVSTTVSLDRNPHFEGLVTEGFARDHQFVRNIFGWDIYTSNRLPAIASETIDATGYPMSSGASNAVTNGVANLFQCVLDDNTRPIMRAWRQMPKTETDRNVKLKRDEFDVTARFGLGAQRVDTLGVILTLPTIY